MSEILFANLNPDYVTYRKDIKYRTQVGLCVIEALKKRGYTRGEETFDIYWAEKQALDSFYVNHRLLRDQRLNHYRSYFEICRKDNLNRNMKKHRRNLEREGKNKEASEYCFLPQTYHLPLEYAIFSDEFKKLMNASKPNIWIMKPTARSQGRGIFLINKLSQITEWGENPDTEAYICQKYIENPLLIGHKKFDLRLYVLCTSYRPLTVHLYRQGFARFTHLRYDETNIASNQIHLTNVAIQKNSVDYSKSLGGKWMLSGLKMYLLTKYGQEAVNNCFYQIKNLIVKTLRGVSKIMSNETNCFQLYGFDVMLDDTLKPWLIEVNGSPSMRANTKKDRELKIGVIDDMLTVLDLEKILSGNQDCLGGFDLICKKDMTYETEYYADSKISLLGCKLDRAKAYRTLATSLNTFHKKNGQQLQQQEATTTSRNRHPVELDSPSPTKKFSVRKPKRISSISNAQQKKETQCEEVKLITKEEVPVFNSVSMARPTGAYSKNPSKSNVYSPTKSELMKSTGMEKGPFQSPQGRGLSMLNPEMSSMNRRRNNN